MHFMTPGMSAWAWVGRQHLDDDNSRALVQDAGLKLSENNLRCWTFGKVDIQVRWKRTKEGTLILACERIERRGRSMYILCINCVCVV